MPALNAKTEAVERLVLLLAALTADWQDRDTIIERVAIYPGALPSARAMFRADMRALAALGFLVERTASHHDPHWRIVGHERFGKKTTAWRERDGIPEKRCPTCEKRGRDPWHAIGAYPKDSARSSGTAIHCKQCIQEDWEAWARETGFSPSPQERDDHRRAIEKASYERMRADHERAEKKRASARAYYERKAKDGFRRVDGKWVRGERQAPRRPNPERDHAIATRHAAGETLEDLAKVYGLTKQRISRICQNEARRDK
jgi:hypothetical protein